MVIALEDVPIRTFIRLMHDVSPDQALHKLFTKEVAANQLTVVGLVAANHGAKLWAYSPLRCRRLDLTSCNQS